jgi:hypothetical protein
LDILFLIVGEFLLLQRRPLDVGGDDTHVFLEVPSPMCGPDIAVNALAIGDGTEETIRSVISSLHESNVRGTVVDKNSAPNGYVPITSFLLKLYKGKSANAARTPGSMTLDELVWSVLAVALRDYKADLVSVVAQRRIYAPQHLVYRCLEKVYDHCNGMRCAVPDTAISAALIGSIVDVHLVIKHIGLASTFVHMTVNSPDAAPYSWTMWFNMKNRKLLRPGIATQLDRKITHYDRVTAAIRAYPVGTVNSKIYDMDEAELIRYNQNNGQIVLANNTIHEQRGEVIRGFVDGLLRTGDALVCQSRDGPRVFLSVKALKKAREILSGASKKLRDVSSTKFPKK